MSPELYVGRVRSVVLISLLIVVTGGLYFFVWFLQTNRELKRHLGEGVRPGGRLTLFILVPVIGWFLAIWWTGRNIRQAQLRAGTEAVLVPLYHGIWAALVPLLGWLIAAGYLQRGANRAWLKMGFAFETSSKTPTLIQCPDCDTRFAALLNPIFPRPVRCPQCGRAGAA